MYPNYQHQADEQIRVGDKIVKINLGKFGEQTSADVLARCGDSVVNCTLTMGGETNLGYFPLSVEFVEKLYAGGIIKGSRWVKRDGRPSDASVLKSRVIDRSIRPLFPKDFMREVQLVNTVFSYDKVNPDDMIGMLAAGVALAVGDIPFNGPIAGIRVAYLPADDKFIINPTIQEQEQSQLDLIVSGGLHSIVMVEAGAAEVPEEIMLRALQTAQNELTSICEQIEKIAAKYKKPTVAFADKSAQKQAKRELLLPFLQKLPLAEVIAQEAQLQEVDLSSQFEEILSQEEVVAAEISSSDLKEIWHDLQAEKIRADILQRGVRADGRTPTEIRPISCEVDLFPRTHGSAMFKRGATQAVTVTTLGSPSLGQMIEDMGGEDVRHYMHFYIMPPYASGETGRIGFPKRREVGHGALAERALLPVIPDQEDFPYTIHVVSEILSSNGSTSQASVCGSTLSLMAAGVPIKRPVAGIAMGLITDGDKYQVLSDIKDVEDHCGDMDFKVAGTQYGITALQMDIKISGISLEILTKALEQARVGRLEILDKMLAVLPEPRAQLSPYAPKIVQLTISADRIGELIGPGGKNIKRLIELSGADIDVEENEDKGIGEINISSSDSSAIDKAREMITSMMKEDVVGDEYDGEVVRIENYGAFVKYGFGKEGLVHVSAMSTEYLDDPHKLVQLGDTVHVRISEIQADGKVKLSMLSREQEEQSRGNRANRPEFRGGRRMDGNRGSRGNFKPRRGSFGSSRGPRSAN